MATKKRKNITHPGEIMVPVTENVMNVFGALDFPDAEELQFKAELTRQIYNRIRHFGMTQVQAAKRLGLNQPDISKLMNGKFTGFSTDRLLALLRALEMDVEIVLKPREQRINPMGVRVLAEVA